MRGERVGMWRWSRRNGGLLVEGQEVVDGSEAAVAWAADRTISISQRYGGRNMLQRRESVAPSSAGWQQAPPIAHKAYITRKMNDC